MSDASKSEKSASSEAAKAENEAVESKNACSAGEKSKARAMMANKLYMRQLPDVLPENYNEAMTEKSHHGNKPCYDCCTEKGCCSPACTVCLVAAGACCCLLCCYATDGFNGVWTYWPN
jgi:hypothetical protein